MAASMRYGGALASRRNLTRILQRRENFRLYSSVQSLQESSEEVVYPKIKPRYPAGKWGKIKPSTAWKIHEQTEDLLQIPNVKMRLERLAGPYDGKKGYLFGMNLIEEMPNTLQYKQYVTKTHAVEGLPDVYNNINTEAVDSAVKRLRPVLEDSLAHEVDQHSYLIERNKITIDERKYFGAHVMARLMSVLQAGLASTVPHLHRSQFDNNVRVETFWKRGGYDPDGDFYVHGSKMGDIVDFQLKYEASLQIRTELPLPEIIPVDDDLCQTGEVPDYRYHPKTAGQYIYRDRPITISGHWVGDPCEFHHLTAIAPTSTYFNYHKMHGDKYVDRDSLSWGITAGFGSTVSQAFNQGFFPWLDITYPFVSQVLISDGQWFRFYTYQLNTIHLWKDDEANPTRNIIWASPKMNLFETIEDGKVKGFNEEVIHQMIKCFLLEPEDRGVNLRPYLPDAAAPVQTKKYINHVGEEPLPQHKIGRFEYPRNAVYF